MKSKTIAQQLNVKDFPFRVKDENSNEIYFEDLFGDWEKQKFDSNNNRIYYEDLDGYWSKYEYDSNGNEIYFEDSNGYWEKHEYDSNDNLIYYEDSTGTIEDNRPKVELTLDEIASKFRIPASQLKIKK